MSDRVNTRRKYDSRRRQRQAERTRQDIVEAAHLLFAQLGYIGTTMSAIAHEAEVAVETIYRGFGSKAALFEAVVEAAVAGGAERASRPVEERPAIRAVIEEVDPRRQIQRYVATQPGIHERLGPLVRTLRAAADVEEALADVWERLERQRLDGMGRFARLLAERGALQGGLSVEEARDVLWTLNSHAVYEKLVDQRGWTPQRYERWLTNTLMSALLAEG
jgi:AcrR family transcriptional regulator